MMTFLAFIQCEDFGIS